MGRDENRLSHRGNFDYHRYLYRKLDLELCRPLSPEYKVEFNAARLTGVRLQISWNYFCENC